MAKQSVRTNETELTPLYHNTWVLLQTYRDAMWSLEVSVDHLGTRFQREFGESVDEFLDSIYMAGMELGGSKLESQAQFLEVTRKISALVDSTVKIMRSRYEHGEIYYVESGAAPEQVLE